MKAPKDLEIDVREDPFREHPLTTLNVVRIALHGNGELVVFGADHKDGTRGRQIALPYELIARLHERMDVEREAAKKKNSRVR